MYYTIIKLLEYKRIDELDVNILREVIYDPFYIDIKKIVINNNSFIYENSFYIDIDHYDRSIRIVTDLDNYFYIWSIYPSDMYFKLDQSDNLNRFIKYYLFNK